MRLLHTSDWHVGKAIRGRSRADEHAAVLAEVAAVADREAVDAVLVGGDLFDSAAPPPEAERIVYDALLRLTADRTRPVVVVAGNHDNPHRLGAVAPVFAAHGVRIVDRPTRPDDGGVVTVTTTGGEALRVGLLPFLSQRTVVTADLLMSGLAADAGGTYAERVRRLLDGLAASFDGDAVNVLLAHLMVMGGTMGGGERGAHTIFDYWVPATAFPVTAQYVGLGHLHRRQQLAGPVPIHYCGSPLQLDFGETANEPAALVVEATPGRGGVTVTPFELTAGRRLHVLRGLPDDLVAQADEAGTAHLKLVVEGGNAPGLADDLRARCPNAVEVVLADAARDEGDPVADGPRRAGRSPHELFGEYLQERDAVDERVVALFRELADDALAAT